jgi:hypothetical protein
MTVLTERCAIEQANFTWYMFFYLIVCSLTL